MDKDQNQKSGNELRIMILSNDEVFLHLKRHAPKKDNDKQGTLIKNKHSLSLSLAAAKICDSEMWQISFVFSLVYLHIHNASSIKHKINLTKPLIFLPSIKLQAEDEKHFEVHSLYKKLLTS